MSDNRLKIQQRRAELTEQITHGEDTLLATRDHRTRQALDQKLTAMRNELQHLTMQLMARPVESLNDFSRRHGGNRVYCNGWFLFPDGAASDRNDTLRREPPDDPFEQLKAKRQYLQAKLNAEIKAFERFHADTVAQHSYHVRYPSSCPPPAADAEEQLARGRGRIRAIRADLKKLDAQLAKTPEAIARRRAVEQERQMQFTMSQRLANIMSISADN